MHRIIFGSNAPVDLYSTNCSLLEIYESMYDLVVEAGIVSNHDVEFIFHYNAIKVYKLNK